MNIKSKTKIVVICGYSDTRLRENLTLKAKRPIFNLLIRLFHLPSRVGIYADHAPWISCLIDEFEKRNDIEFHIITSHISMKKSIQEFEQNGIFYHVYCSEFSSFVRVTKNFRVWKLLQRNSRIVCSLIEKIKPDLVNIIGIENPATAIPALYIDNYPVFSLCQTIYSNPERRKYSVPATINWELEEKIIQRKTYFGVYSQMHFDLLKQKNPNAIIFDFKFPQRELPTVQPLNKKYDFVNFALQLDDRKGLYDSLQALALVKKEFPSVKLNLIGRCDPLNREKSNNIIKELNLSENVVFTPFFEKQEDLFQHLQYSRFALLPCKLDVISGTMRQAMHYGLPLVVYKTTGTPTLNLAKECALISEMNNIKDLASNMLILLKDSNRANLIIRNSKEYIIKHSSNEDIIDRLFSDYQAIIRHFYNKETIPNNLLFETE